MRQVFSFFVDERESIMKKELSNKSSSLLKNVSEPINNETNLYATKGTKEEQRRAALVLAALAGFSDLALLMKEDEVAPAMLSKEESALIENLSKRGDELSIQTTSIESEDSTAKADEMENHIASQWEEVKCNYCKLSNHVLNDIEISCDLETFHDQFLSNDAPYSVPYFLSKIGDLNISVSQWTPSSSNPNMFTRTIQYLHPVNAPMAPPQAKATKEQKLLRYTKYGICLVTTTVVNDLPLTDCFVVKDEIILEQVSQEVSKLNARFEIIFTKHTIWKCIIQSTTNHEFIHYFSRYADMLQEILGVSTISEETKEQNNTILSKIEEEEGTIESIVTLPEIRNKEVSFTTFLDKKCIMLSFVFLVFVMVQQFFFMRQLFKVNNTNVSIQKELLNLQQRLEKQGTLSGKGIEMISQRHENNFCDTNI